MAVVTGQAYPVIVGGGGAGGTFSPSPLTKGANGSDSQFASILSSGGGGGASATGNVNGASGGSGGGGEGTNVGSAR
jgi:hypothetical protein